LTNLVRRPKIQAFHKGAMHMTNKKVKKVKTSEATGAALDYLVSKASNPPGQCGLGWWERDDEGFLFDPLNECRYSPSTDWEQGSSLIEWVDMIQRVDGISIVVKEGNIKVMSSGPTALIAAARCYVTANLGEEVEIPDEL